MPDILQALTMIEGYMYILKRANGLYYTGSTKNSNHRLAQHQNAEGANFTKKHLPVELVYVELVYCEEFQRIDEAFYREKQVQDWSRKKEVLIHGEFDKLPKLSKNYTQYRISASSMPKTAVEPTKTNETTKKQTI